MRDQQTFEAMVAAAYDRWAAEVPTSVNALAFVRATRATPVRSRPGSRPTRPLALALLLGIAVAVAGGGAAWLGSHPSLAPSTSLLPTRLPVATSSAVPASPPTPTHSPAPTSSPAPTRSPAPTGSPPPTGSPQPTGTPGPIYADVFTPTGKPLHARYGDTATLLPNGSVLVVGGRTASGDAGLIADAELWDPATETFGPAGSLAVARSGHTATLLPDGRVLIVGGSNDAGALDSAELWDPTTESFSPAGLLSRARQGHTAMLLAGGRVLVVGGLDDGPRRDVSGQPLAGLLASPEIWEPATESFRPAGSIPEARKDLYTATMLRDGRVLIVGGREAGPGDAVLAAAELWDPATATVVAAGELAEARGHPTTTLLPDGSVLIVGGFGGDATLATAELWDPATESFAPAGLLSQAQDGQTATLLADGRVLIAGGQYSSGSRHVRTDAPVELWDPTTRTFGPGPAPLGTISGGTATLLPDGRVLFVGHSHAEIYH